MRTRRSLAVVAVGFLVFWLAVPVQAGGWAVVTMDSLPATFTAGQEYTLGFALRQHGVTLLGGQRGMIAFTHAESGRTVAVQATDAGPEGHYAARVALPTEGTWRWTVQSFGEHPMPPLTVVAPTPATPATPERPAWLLVAIPAFAAVAVFGLIGGTRGRRRTPTLALR